jgi:glycosyltransferase involved in cell wall biosynthesis
MDRKEFAEPPSLGIIVPAYNEETNIEEAIAGIKTACKFFPHEILVIDDGSTDATYELASKAKATVIRHPKNMGKGASLRTAIKVARGKYDILVVQDADLTIPAKYIPNLVDKVWRGESDVVYASRMMGLIADGAMPTYRLIGNRLFAWVISTITRQKLKDTLSGQKVFDARVLEQIEIETDGWPDFELIFKVWALGYRTSEVPVSYLPRKGRSKMKVIQHGSWFIWQMLKWYLRAVTLRS